MRKNTGFTLIEVLVAVVLSGMILVTGYSTFQRVMQAQSRLGATIDIQKNLFYTNEKLATLIRGGGTLDYEEYFNRRMLGYTKGWVNTSPIYTFSTRSHFGNGNNALGRPTMYLCGMVDTGPTPDVTRWANEESCLTANAVFNAANPPPVDGNATLPTPLTPTVGGHQPYGQYATLALNHLDPIGYPFAIELPPIFETGKDIKIFDRRAALGVGALVDENATNVGLPELYLIKENLDGTYDRTYFRHIYVDDPASSAPCAPEAAGNSIAGCLGRIQITKLTACDTLLAGGGTGSDGIIDAWIPQCDFNATIPSPDCSSLSAYKTNTCPDLVTDIYTSAHEETIGLTPPNLAWVDVTDPDMNIVRATFLPSPLKIPTLMSGAGDDTKSAQVSLYLEVTLSTKLRNKSFVLPTYNYPRTLITTYDLSE